MRRRFGAIVALLVLALVVALLMRAGRRSEARTDVRSTLGEAPPPSAPEPVPAPVERIVIPAEAQPVPTPSPKAAETAEPERADLEARDWLEIRVVDPEVRPVFDAELRIDGLRKGDDGSWYEMAGGPALARTDARGVARIWHTRWVDIDGRTSGVDLSVTHPAFAPFRDGAFPIGRDQRTVVLRRGAGLTVTGWYGSPAALVTDVSISVDSDAALDSGAWTRDSDGRLTTQRLSPGPHLIQITHESAERGRLASAIESFELLENEWKELSLELFARTALRGRLAASVPRPVRGGHVWVNLHARPGTQLSLWQDFEASVGEDGSFEIDDLPPGEGQIIAWCEGSVSERVKPATPEEAGFHFLEPPTPEQVAEVMAGLDESDLRAQRVTLPAPEPIVVAMEATGALEVTVRTAAGAPLAGAAVWASPNVQWTGVGSIVFPWNEWQASTDALGRARIEGLPPDESLWFGAEHEAFRMTRADRDQTPSARIVSGQTTTRELALEPNED